jgi:phage gp29-like protein
MLVTSKQARKPVVRYDPSGYKRARRAYDHGDPRPLIKMMKEARTDARLWGLVDGRRSGFKRDWTLQPYEDSSEAEDRAAWMESVLSDGRLQIYDLFEAIHNGRYFLYSVVDFEWTVENGRQVPVGFKEFDQHKFRYPEDSDELRIDFGQGDLREIPETAIVSEARKLPVMLPVLRDWILLEFGFKAWASFMENVAEPFLLGRYPQGVDDDFKDQVEEAVKTIARSSRGIAPKGTDIEHVESGRTSGDHDRFITELKAGISLALLGHENAVRNEGGVDVGGENAEFKVRRHIAVGDMRFIEPRVQRLIRIVGDQNWGDGRYPTFSFDKKKEIDKQEHMDAIRLTYDIGAPVKGSELQKLGIDVPADAVFQKDDNPIDELMTE